MFLLSAVPAKILLSFVVVFYHSSFLSTTWPRVSVFCEVPAGVRHDNATAHLLARSCAKMEHDGENDKIL